MDPDLPYSVFVWRGIFNGPDTLLLVLVALMLGLGGLLRERAAGFAVFTLSLPVKRWQILVSRALVGVLEVCALAAIPALIVPALSERIGHPYPLVEALRFSVMFATVAAACFAAGFLMSTALPGEHTATVAVVLLPFLHLAFVNQPALRTHPGLNVFNVMTGARMPYLDRSTAFIASLPWLLIAVFVVIAAALIVAGILVSERHDF